MNKQKLDSRIDVEVEELRNTLGTGFQGEVLGYGVMYSVGADWNCIVPRNWLLKRTNELGIPDYLIPNKVCPRYGYTRAIQRMEEEWDNEYRFDIERGDTGRKEPHRVVVDFLEGDGQDLMHIQARVFFTEEEIKEEGGKWVSHSLGYLNFSTDRDRIVSRMNKEIEESDPLLQIWKDVTDTATEFYEEMLTSHISRDIRNMMYHAIKKHTNKVIQLQRSVYLFPAGMGDFVEKMSTLYAEIDENFKNTREPVAVRTFEVLNTEEKRDWIEYKVEEELKSNVNRLIEEAFEAMDEGETAHEVITTVRENLTEQQDTAQTYNALLQAEIDIRDQLEEQRRAITNQKKEKIIDKVLSESDQTDIGSY